MESAMRGLTSSRAAPAGSPRVVGRAAELSALGGLAAGTAAGRGGVAWLQGEPGIGKSTLLDVTIAQATALGCRVLRGGGDELMKPFPLRLMADCLGISARSPDPAAVRIAGLLAGRPPGPDGLPATDSALSGPGPADPVLAAGEQMLDLVDRLCAAGPVVLAVEDLHWADEPTLALWYRLARAVDQVPLLLLGAARPLPQRDKLARLRELTYARGGLVLDLHPLDLASAAEIASGIAGATPGPRLLAALERAAGNPLYVRELVEALVRDGRVDIRGDVAELRGDPAATPEPLLGAISSRLRFLPPETRKALRMGAVLGQEFDPGDLLAIMDMPLTKLADVLGGAVAGGVLSDAGARLRFRHELIHQVLLEETPLAVRRTLHTGIARTLAAAGRETNSVARHLMAVPGPMPDWALDWLEGIPDSAAYAQPQVVAELLTHATGSAGPDDPHWETLAGRLAGVLQWLGRDEDAQRVGTEIVHRTADATLAARMRILVIRARFRQLRFADLLPLCASPGDESLPPALCAQLGAWSAMALTHAGRESEGRAMADDALARAVASGDPLAVAYAHCAASICTTDPLDKIGHTWAALEALSARRADDVESQELRLMLLTNLITFAVRHAKRDDAEQALAQALQLADRVRSFRGADAFGVAAQYCYWYGRWDETLVHVAAIDAQFQGTDWFAPDSAFTVLIALHREDRRSADTHLAVITRGASGLSQPRSRLTRALSMRAEAEGELAQATAVLARWLTATEPFAVQKRYEDMPDLVRLAMETGDLATAKAAAATAADDAMAYPAAGRAAAARFCQAQVDDDADGLLAVASDYGGYGWPLCQALALEEAAVRLAAAEDVIRARAALTDAVRLYGELGATWDARRADARLRRHGVRRGPRSGHRRATTGWEALTPTENRIARLVADGLSNPDIAAELFLSRRTVQTHVSSILAKLGFRSRVELIRTAVVPSAAPQLTQLNH